MEVITFSLDQAAQRRVPGGMIALYGAAVDNGGIVADLGIATANGASDLTIAIGAYAAVPNFGDIHVVDIHVGGPSSRTKALITFTPTGATE